MICQMINDDGRQCNNQDVKSYKVLLDCYVFYDLPDKVIIYICDECIKKYKTLSKYAEKI